LQSFLDPKSDAFGNYRQSAMRAGYSQDYADNISLQMPNWLKENLGKSRKLVKAENNLDLALDGLLDDPEKGAKQYQYKATEFTLKTLGKEDYTERQEVTGKDGKDLIPEELTKEEREKLSKLLNE